MKKIELCVKNSSVGVKYWLKNKLKGPVDEYSTRNYTLKQHDVNESRQKTSEYRPQLFCPCSTSPIQVFIDDDACRNCSNTASVSGGHGHPRR